MRYISLLSILFFQLGSTALSAATFELNVAELFPQQSLIQTVQIEADNLQAEIILNDGHIINAITDNPWPSVSDIAQVSVKGPEVQFKVITQSGSEWTRLLGSFDLQLSNEVNGYRKEMMLDLHAIPINKIFDQKDSSSTPSFVLSIFKTVMLIANGDLHLNLAASADLEDNAHPSMEMTFELNNQSLMFELHDQHDDVKMGAWKLRGNAFGKGSLIDLVLSAIRIMSEECKKMSAEKEYDQMLQQVFYGVDLFLDLTAPISAWTGVTLTAEGTFDYLSKDTGEFTSHINNHFQLDAYDGSWNTYLGSNSFISVGIEDSPTWSQEFILKNPSHDLEKAATWIQEHWANQLATLLDMPSIKYYANYFPKYFIQGLTIVMSNLGETQEDGTVSYQITSDSLGSFTIAGFAPAEIASQFVAKIKETIGGWWGI